MTRSTGVSTTLKRCTTREFCDRPDHSMIDLHPVPETDHRCPDCDVELDAVDWYIPGMLMLAELACPDCGREFYGNLAAGQGLLNPAVLDKKTGSVTPFVEENWFTSILRDGYADRQRSDISLQQSEPDALADPILLDCLDLNYIHSVGKLLNADYYYQNHPERDLIALVPEFLEWMVPEAVDATWVVDVSLRDGQRWDDALAEQIHAEVERFESCSLSTAFLFPDPEEYDIEWFTGVEPFPLPEWANRLEDPTVTFVWRGGDSSARRLWCSWIHGGGIGRKARGYLNLVDNKFGNPRLGLREQRRNIVQTARQLRTMVADVDCAIAGLGTEYSFPDWMADLRFERPDADQERQLCRQYAKSHVVAGVHGSHMALPSAHAGGLVQLIPPAKRGNMTTDLLFQGGEFRETLLRTRILPTTVSTTTVAREIAAVLLDWPRTKFRLDREWFRHGTSFDELNKIKAEERRLREATASATEEGHIP